MSASGDTKGGILIMACLGIPVYGIPVHGIPVGRTSAYAGLWDTMQPDPRPAAGRRPAPSSRRPDAVTSQPAAEVVLAAISAEPLSVDAVLAAVRDPRARRGRRLRRRGAGP